MPVGPMDEDGDDISEYGSRNDHHFTSSSYRANPSSPEERNVSSMVVQPDGPEHYMERLQHHPYYPALRLRYIERYSYSEIAKCLSLPIGTVKSHINRGMKALHLLESISEEKEQWRTGGEDHNRIEPHMISLVDKLPEHYRNALRLHYLEGLSYPEMARQLDLPIGTVKSQVYRGMKLLRRFAGKDTE